MMKKCYNKTHNKALRDGNLKGLLINNSLSGVIMTVSNNTRYIERGQSHETKLVYGVGYNSRRDHRLNINNKPSGAYRAWHGMMRRCYDPKALKRSPTYVGCAVSDEWHDFQDFADWFYANPYSNLGYQLDKDLLSPKNKTYSPSTCVFVPHEINSLLLNHESERGDFPQGVYMNKGRGMLMAMLRVDGKQRFLGYFDCPNEAYQAYKTAKECHVKNKAIEWQDRIANNVFEALMNWSLPDV
jgi:hypothetical protein